MIPVIALVGRPNVGKSTLFNRLTRTQDALVADYPGLTRDRQYGEACFHQKPFIVVDTGGIGVDDRAVDTLMSSQSQKAIEESDAIFFVVDARSGLQGIDKEIAQKIRKWGKSVYLIINKIDGLDDMVATADFQSLGFSEVFAVSATHGKGISQLLQVVMAPFPAPTPLEDDGKTDAIRIAFIGRPNVGKSTLVNRMLGEERVVVYDMPGTTRDSIAIPFERDGAHYTLIDTAGVRRRARVHEFIEKFSVIKTLQSIKESHVCLMLIDAKEGITEQDLHLLGFIIESGKALILVVNKWDGLDMEHKEDVKSTLDRRLGFVSFAKTRYISALHGSGVGTLFQDIQDAYASSMKSLSTPRLNKLLQDIVAQHPPPMVKGRRVKLRYAHLGGHNPPLVVIHGNQLNELPDSYKRYVSHALIKQLNLIGTPLKLEFKNSNNPFKDRKNTLTDRQIKHKQRLLKRVKRRS